MAKPPKATAAGAAKRRARKTARKSATRRQVKRAPAATASPANAKSRLCHRIDPPIEKDGHPWSARTAGRRRDRRFDRRDGMAGAQPARRHPGGPPARRLHRAEARHSVRPSARLARAAPGARFCLIRRQERFGSSRARGRIMFATPLHHRPRATMRRFRRPQTSENGLSGRRARSPSPQSAANGG